MMSRHFVLAALVAGVSAGCSTLSQDFHPLETYPCSGACEIPVGAIYGPPTKVVVTGGKDQPITWKLGLFGLFSARGIEFDDVGRKVLTKCTTSTDAKQVTCSNSGAPGEYKYTVRFSNERVIDPWVVNQ